MKINIKTDKASYKAGESFNVRVVVYNETYLPETFNRTWLVGPNPVPEHVLGVPMPVSLEPSFTPGELDTVGLNPGCYYGRERDFSFGPGRVVFYAYLLTVPSDSNPPQWDGPADQALVAEPLEITIT